MAEERELNPELTTDTMTNVQQESDTTEDSIVQPEEEQLRPQRRKKRKKKHYLLKFFILIIIVGAAFLVMSSSRFDITEIKVEGNVNIAVETAIEDSGIKTGDNIFFMNKRQIVKKMQEKSPLYGDVTIDRQLPGTLTINVAERTAAMTLPYGEKYVVLDAQGIVIGLVDSQPQVTEINGITIKKMDSGEEVEPKEAEIYQQSVEIIQKANAADLFFKSVSVGEKEVVCNVYDRLYVKCTYDELIKIIDNGDLKGVLSDLYGRKIKRGTVTVEKKGYCSFSPTFE
ncbi:cell division protein FtsQ/DivIB [Gallibacter intestinalis]|uniref:FtsQ-type POTRA domain-containing protein n=1 Tax=Gallibacter intestinalis TaxID=2779356 RepID=A0ABR9QY63_9FIRM|nr:FtsQ-type POTRA domain-containing protein [Gallibacter intestinalis]MBE5035788.1 FtsQ-type POTRA domain-containing protein [Gallibacter intestinalis]